MMRFWKITAIKTWRTWRNLDLWKKVTAGLVLGVIAGIILREKASELKIIGDIFIRLIRMIIVPLIYVSIVMAITNVNDTSTLSRITIKALFWVVITTLFAITIGLTISYILEPGKDLDPIALGISAVSKQTAVKSFSFRSIMEIAIPDNALNSLVSGELLQVIFFSFFTGFTINILGKEKRIIASGFKIASKIVFKMINLILEFAPYGAFGFTAAVVGTQGLNVLKSLGILMIAFVIAMILQYIVFGMLILINGLSPITFFRKSLDYQILAFSTGSSKATLPATMRTCEDELGISNVNTTFLVPLGAAINMNGTALYIGICSLFFAQIYNIDLTTTDYILIILTSTLGSIGAAGIPSGSIIMLPMVLATIKIPVEGIALIAGVDRILDMLRTALNITGDATVALLVDKSEGTLNKRIYNSPKVKMKF